MRTSPALPSRWTIGLAACILTLPGHRGVAQSTDSTRAVPLTSLSGVFTAAQAIAGRNVYQETCRSCHTPGELNDKGFWAEWVGRTVADLFLYLRDNMPKDNPASLSGDDYANVTSFLLQLNQMPPGDRALPADSAALANIRIAKADTVKPPETTQKRTAP